MQERGAAPTLSAGGTAAAGAWRRWLVVGLIAGVVITADQLSKTWAEHHLYHHPYHVAWKLDLVLEYNTGSAFGLAQGWAPVVGGLALVVVVGLLAIIRRVRTNVMTVSMGLVLGGAVGNLSDRVFRAHHGAVVDFIALHFWPTFNVADSCVVVGSLLAAFELWRVSESKAPTGTPAL